MAITQTKANQLYLDGWLGQYSLGVSLGFVNQATTGEIFQFRWTNATNICCIQRLSLLGISSAAQTALVVVQVDIIKATGWSGQGTGTTAVDMTGGTNKRRTGMPTSLIAAGDIRYSGVPLGAGTKTLETNSLASILATGSGNPQFPYGRVIESKPGDGEYPLVLAANEGFVVKVIQNTTGANGIAWSVNVDWLETAQS